MRKVGRRSCSGALRSLVTEHSIHEISSEMSLINFSHEDGECSHHVTLLFMVEPD